MSDPILTDEDFEILPAVGDLAFDSEDHPLRVLEIVAFSDGTLAARVDYPDGTHDVVSARDLVAYTHTEWRFNWEGVRRAPFRKAEDGLGTVVGWMRPMWPSFRLSAWGVPAAPVTETEAADAIEEQAAVTDEVAPAVEAADPETPRRVQIRKSRFNGEAGYLVMVIGENTRERIFVTTRPIADRIAEKMRRREEVTSADFVSAA